MAHPAGHVPPARRPQESEWQRVRDARSEEPGGIDEPDRARPAQLVPPEVVEGRLIA